jgi:hypothetical protein
MKNQKEIEAVLAKKYPKERAFIGKFLLQSISSLPETKVEIDGNRIFFPESIQATFGVEGIADYEKSLIDVVTGSGQEGRKISSIESSSLLSFLFFVNVSKDNPLTINGVQYTQRFFEVQCKVITSPSNIDVMLVSEDESQVLCLESKFIEYIRDTSTIYKVPKSYMAAYDRLNLQAYVGEEVPKDSFFLQLPSVPRNDTQKKYYGGIKQLISHYIGMANEPNNKRLNAIWKKSKVILLGTVLFKFKDGEAYLSDYTQLYQDLAKRLNAKAGKVQMLGKVITYQDLERNGNLNLPEMVKQYYFKNSESV